MADEFEKLELISYPESSSQFPARNAVFRPQKTMYPPPPLPHGILVGNCPST